MGSRASGNASTSRAKIFTCVCKMPTTLAVK
jgi:hypothetical protein